MIASLLKQTFDPRMVLPVGVCGNFAELGTLESFPKETVLRPSHTIEAYFNFIQEGSGGNLFWTDTSPVGIDFGV